MLLQCLPCAFMYAQKILPLALTKIVQLNAVEPIIGSPIIAAERNLSGKEHEYMNIQTPTPTNVTGAALWVRRLWA